MLSFHVLAFAAVVGGTTTQASEDVDVKKEEDSFGKLTLNTTYLVHVASVGRLRVDANGDGQTSGKESYGQNHLVQHRLRFRPRATFHSVLSLFADVQLSAGYLAVDPPRQRFVEFGPPRGKNGRVFAKGQDWDNEIKLRKFYFDWRSPVGALMMGRMASSWGLGLLANSGDEELQDWGGTHFGTDRNFGDVVNRIVFATAPLALGTEAEWAKRWLLAVGGDIVERDERIDFGMGDVAFEGIGALRYQHEKQEAGLYVAYRDLEDRNDDVLRVWALDFFGRGTWTWRDIELFGTGEVAWVTGMTSLARNNAFLREIDVDQLGYVARAGAKYIPWSMGLDVELGYASGDSNPNDRYLRNFTFDPDYNPSLILFEELRAAESVAAAANASDPERVGYPPDSARLLPTNGAVTNAVYLRPTLRSDWRSIWPDTWGELKTRVAVLWAFAEEDLVDPYASTLVGGTTINHQGGDGRERDLGFELNVGADYVYLFDDWLKLHASVQMGRLWPGAAFKNASRKSHPPINALFARLAFELFPPL